MSDEKLKRMNAALASAHRKIGEARKLVESFWADQRAHDHNDKNTQWAMHVVLVQLAEVFKRRPDALVEPDIQCIDSCTECPYADSEPHDDRWLCHAIYTTEGWPTPIPTPSEISPAPEGCPLRKAPRLVVFRG